MIEKWSSWDELNIKKNSFRRMIGFPKLVDTWRNISWTKTGNISNITDLSSKINSLKNHINIKAEKFGEQKHWMLDVVYFLTYITQHKKSNIKANINVNNIFLINIPQILHMRMKFDVRYNFYLESIDWTVVIFQKF